MIRSMFSGVSGLRTHQIMMDTIGNNIANINTTGFKSSQVAFEDLLSQTITGATPPQAGRGGTNPQQVGLGVKVASITQVFTQGALQATGRALDLAIQGDGFFVLNDGGRDLYSRAGSFGLDNNGNIVNPANGYRVQGWMADATGAINTNVAIGNIAIPIGMDVQPRATTSIEYTGNIDARVSNGTTYQMPINIRDSQGVPHDLVVVLTKTNNNEWSYTVTIDTNTLNADQTLLSSRGLVGEVFAAVGSTITANSILKTGTIVSSAADQAAIGGIYNAFNALTSDQTVAADVTLAGNATIAINSTLAANTVLTAGSIVKDSDDRSAIGGTYGATPATGDTGILQFNADGSINIGASTIPVITYDLVPVNGAAMLSITPDFTGLSQYGSVASAAATSQDGYTSGSLQDVIVSNSGVVSGIFTNGISMALAQIAMANFNNASGLIKQPGGVFLPSPNSGIAQVGASGSRGLGEVAAGALEMSNVDLAKEFTNMIVAQRGFQANSRIITTSDEMLQELVNLKR